MKRLNKRVNHSEATIKAYCSCYNTCDCGNCYYPCLVSGNTGESTYKAGRSLVMGYVGYNDTQYHVSSGK